MIERRNPSGHLLGRFALCLFLILAVCLPAMADDDRLSSAVPLDGPWADSIEFAQHGEFDKARDVLEKITAHGDIPAKAAGWLRTWLDAERSRAQMTREDYEDYIRRAKKWHDADDLTKAVTWAYRAMLSTTDQDSFRQLPWLLKLRDDVMAKAAEHRRNHEWKDAHALYYSLSLIFENDEQIDELRKQCLEHARLDEIYKPEDEQEWRESLEGIDPAMVEEALWRIDQKYVEEADFRAMTIAGYKMLLLIADSPTLQKQFEGLTGERGEQFVARIERRLQQVKDEQELTHRQALQYFRRALKINGQTAQIPKELLVREYMNAALEKLDDFTAMIWPYDFREFEKHTRGDFIGVGIQIRNKYNTDIKDDEILVVTPLEGTPAYRAGIQANDVITAVNGKSLTGIPVTKAVHMITGPLGTKVTLTVRRTLATGEDKDIDFELKREIVEIQSVKSHARLAGDEENWNYILDPDLGIAYVSLLSFQENTVDQLTKALSTASAQGMKGLILDLRFDPGGLLPTAIRVAELFLSKGERVVSTKGLRSPEWGVDAEEDGQYKDLPLIVLVNEASASASEIVAGAIKDHKRGLIIGERTFGKFSVQNLIQLVRSEAHLKLTTARYYLPSGRSLHREKGAKTWGVEPDIPVPLVPKEYQKIIYMRRDADVIGAVKTKSEEELKEPIRPSEEDDADADTNGAATATDANSNGAADAKAEPKEEPDENNRPDRDPQLQTALLIMRMNLLTDRSGRMVDGRPAPADHPADNAQSEVVNNQ